MTDIMFQEYLELHTRETQDVFQKRRVKRVIPRINLVVANTYDSEFDTFPIHIDRGFPKEREKQCCLLFKMGYEFFRFGFIPEAIFLVSSVFLKTEKKRALIVAGLTLEGTARIAVAHLKKLHNHFCIDNFVFCPKRDLLLTFFFLGFKSAKRDTLSLFN
jgi:hypothetical protein